MVCVIFAKSYGVCLFCNSSNEPYKPKRHDKRALNEEGFVPNVAKLPRQMKPFSLMDVYNQPPSSLDSILKLSFKSTKFIFSWLTLRKIFQIKINIFLA